jgi:hypothetical protein
MDVGGLIGIVVCRAKGLWIGRVALGV